MSVSELSVLDRLTVALVPLTGIGMVALAYTASSWIGGDSDATFAQLGSFIPDPPPEANARLFDAYFSWLGWTLLSACAIVTVVFIGVGLMSRRSAMTTLVLSGLTGALTTILAIWFEAPRLLDVSRGRLTAVIDTTSEGFWIAVVGYLIVALSGPVLLAATKASPGRAPDGP